MRISDWSSDVCSSDLWSDIVAADLPPLFDALKQSAREIGGRQIQNAGTVAGNLCNASPAADSVPPLLAMQARVEARGAKGRRELALADFIAGKRRIARKPGQEIGRATGRDRVSRYV